MVDLLSSWLDRYPIVSIEDPLGEDDPDPFRIFTQRYNDSIQIIGDDFLVTSAERIVRAADAGICNSALIKPNQAGTVTETKAALDAARNSRMGYRRLCSFRRDRRRYYRPPRSRMGRGAVEGRLLRPFRTYGKVE